MKKLFTLLAMVLGMVSTANAQQAATLEELGLQEGQGYFAKTFKRGTWYYDATHNWTGQGAGLWTAENGGVTVDQTDPYFSFGFVVVDDSIYLYSIGADRILNLQNERAVGGLLALPLTPVYLHPTNNGAWATPGEAYTDIVFSYQKGLGSNNFNCAGDNRMLIDGWTTPDDGNRVLLTPTDFTFDPDALRAELELNAVIAPCIELANKINDAKTVKKGTRPTEYNIPESASVLLPGSSNRSLRTVYNNIAEYIVDTYYAGKTKEEIETILDQLQRIWEAVETTFVTKWQLVAGEPLQIEAEMYLPEDGFYYEPEAASHANAAINLQTRTNGTSLWFEDGARRRYATRYYINVPEGAEGTYVVTGKHGCMMDRFFGVQVNDEIEHVVASSNHSSGWDVQDADIDGFKVNLKAGDNVLVLRGFYYFYENSDPNNYTASNTIYTPSIDYLLLTKAEADEEIAESWTSKEFIWSDAEEGSTITNVDRNGFKNSSFNLDGDKQGTFIVDAPAEGAYVLEFVYGTGENRKIGVSYNSPLNRKVVEFSNNGSWDNAPFGRQVYLKLEKGENTITLDGAGSNSPNIDFFYVKQVQTEGFEVTAKPYPIKVNLVANWNGEAVKDLSLDVEPGKTVGELVSANLDNGFVEIAEYDKDVVAVADETYTIDVEWTGPFVLDGSKLYNLDIRDSKWLNAVLDGDHYNNKNKGDVSEEDLDTAPYQWSFIGNPYQILIFNASTERQTLTHVGNFAVMQDGEYLWNVYKNGNGFGLECSDQAGNYVNDNGSRLGFWADPNNAKYDGGGKIKVFEAANPVVTSISSVAVSTNTNAVYNLNGQRVEAPAKGLYIQNGKKFVVK